MSRKSPRAMAAARKEADGRAKGSSCKAAGTSATVRAGRAVRQLPQWDKVQGPTAGPHFAHQRQAATAPVLISECCLGAGPSTQTGGSTGGRLPLNFGRGGTASAFFQCFNQSKMVLPQSTGNYLLCSPGLYMQRITKRKGVVFLMLRSFSCFRQGLTLGASWQWCRTWPRHDS